MRLSLPVAALLLAALVCCAWRSLYMWFLMVRMCLRRWRSRRPPPLEYPSDEESVPPKRD